MQLRQKICNVNPASVVYLEMTVAVRHHGDPGYKGKRKDRKLENMDVTSGKFLLTTVTKSLLMLDLCK